ncbi:EscJ/YscJ/HrcJ family type III secretion inner membrane ring protein [Agaricicola taiwanensis]|uniref:Lipoprotein n=1 Tax=Agaricicola taiwanensis TaxID=591372 RepID=A0A8J2VUK8_9RHOB|nr:type III secretion inner membrane ring lipoprotein SctJ [Agaricicola taiwanensis]GGE35980.1 EscJ/YscJ/HrcJ family type III secretion inner membrane ring protein [Agaricicola taiwanensis]
MSRISYPRVAAALLVGFFLSACKVDLYTNLDERQANEMTSVLMENGISASRAAGQGESITIQVEETQFAQAVEILKQAGLPRQEFASLGTVFQQDGLVASPMQERAQMIYALSQELSQTVSDIDGVVSARVHLVLPENDPLKQNLMPSSASIFIRHHASAPIQDLVPQIKMLVANGVAGLSYDKVSTILVPVTTAYDAPAKGAGLAGSSGSFFGSGLILYITLGVLIVAGALIGLTVWQRRQRVYPLQDAAGAK